MQWDKDLGGYGQEYLKFVQQTADGGFILGGLLSSGISGDKSQPTRDTCSNCSKKDFWIVKTDALGIKQWDRDFGGEAGEDELSNIIETNDGGYLIAGASYSNAGGDKSEDNLGAGQTWVIKTDAMGVKQWDKTIFTAGHDELGFAFQTADGCYTIANYTDAGTGGYKSQPGRGNYDYWMVKFCDTTLSAGLDPAIANNAGITIHPNPFTSVISISTQKENVKQVTLTIKNLPGQVVFNRKETNTAGTYAKAIDLTFLSNGIYFLEVIVDGERTVKKLVKQ